MRCRYPSGPRYEFRGVVDLIEGQAIMYSDGRDDVADPPEFDARAVGIRAGLSRLPPGDDREDRRDRRGPCSSSTWRARTSAPTTSALPCATPPSTDSWSRCCAVARCEARASTPCSTPSSATCRPPLDVPAVEGTVPGTDAVEIRDPLDSEPLSALAFKVVVDPYVGPARVPAHLLRNGRIRRPPCAT